MDWSDKIDAMPTLLRGSKLAQRARDCVALVFHEGCAADRGIDYGELRVVLDLFDRVILPTLHRLAKDNPEDLT